MRCSCCCSIEEGQYNKSVADGLLQRETNRRNWSLTVVLVLVDTTVVIFYSPSLSPFSAQTMLGAYRAHHNS